MSTPIPRLGLVGAGFHATTNIVPALGLAGVPLAALATRDAARSAEALARFGSPGATPYGSAAELLADDSLDGVIVVAQPADQARLTREAIAAGRPVFTDKPLGWTASEARVIAREAEAAGVPVRVGFMKRHAPVYRRLRALLDSGELGTLRSFSVQFACDSTPFCRDEEEFLKLAAIHLVDLVRHLFGEAVVVGAANAGEGANVALSITLRFASGVTGTLDLTGLPSRANETESIRVSGDRGYAETQDAVELRVHTVPDAPTAAPGWQSLPEAVTVHRPAESAMSGIGRDLYLRGFVGELRDFADLVSDAGPAGIEAATESASGIASAIASDDRPSDAWDNVLTMQLIDDLLAASAAERAARAVPDPGTLERLEFGPPGAFRDQLVALILSGRKTGSTTLRVAYALPGGTQAVPRPGERRALIGSSGEPVAVIEYLEVVDTALDTITVDLAAHESPSPEAWRAAHVAYFETLTEAVRAHLGDPAWAATAPGPLVTTVFRVVGVL
ncbi:MAG: Gfo/Idh/MocA family oxidoreductase [Herbiconiux sp.]|nr:Gfo/Idh/MocA family oxidoreductase [Herbiconiux sp.]